MDDLPKPEIYIASNTSIKKWVYLFSVIIILLAILTGTLYFLANKPPTDKINTSIPVPLNHQSVQNAVVTYFFSGRIEKIASNSGDLKGKKLILVSDNGTRFPQVVIMPDNTIVYSTNTKGEIANQITQKELKEGSAVSIDILYNTKTNQFIPSIIRLK